MVGVHGDKRIEDIVAEVSGWPAHLRKPTFHTVGLAVDDGSVEDWQLAELSRAGSGEGKYRKATKLVSQELQEFFVLVLAGSVPGIGGG